MKLLLAEDYTLLRQLLIDVLSADFEVEAFPDGEAAWERYAARADFDLALLDCHMPRLGGLELLSRIRRREPGLPVLLMSAGLPPEATGAGATVFVEKPFASLAELRALLLGSVRAAPTTGAV